MFNNKKIANQQIEIDELKNELSIINESLNKILDTLDGDNFSKDWEEYQKYKKLKDKLPDIEEMYQLKKLKELIIERKEYNQMIILAEFEVLKSESTRFPKRHVIIAMRKYLDIQIHKYESVLHEIDETLLFIKNKSQQKDLIEIFKLYAISTDWLKP